MTQLEQDLLEVRKLIEKGWTQNTFARDKDGFVCTTDSEEAVSWCLVGAIERVTNNRIHAPSTTGRNTRYHETIEYIKACLPRRYATLSGYNDNVLQSKAQALALIDKVLGQAEG